MSTLRDQISPDHPVLQGARILCASDILRASDRTACTSMLLSPQGEPWTLVSRACHDMVGKTVGHALSDEVGDMDRHDRLYVRPSGRQKGG